MLVYNTVEHDARVRRSARSLNEAGFEVIVLGVAPDGSAGTRSWPGFDLRLVPRRDRALDGDARLGVRVEELRQRSEEMRRRMQALREQPPPTGYASQLARRGRARMYRARSRRAKERFDRARRSEAQAQTAKGLRVSGDPLGLRAYEETWWPLVRRLRPDVVHVHDAHGLLVARRAAGRGARWIYDAHEDPLKKGAVREDRRATLRRQVAEHLRHADGVITVSEPLADRLVRTFDLGRPPVVVHNTPPLGPGGPPPAAGLREQAGVAPDAPLVVYAGSMTSRRRLSVVVEALVQLPAVHLALVVSPTNKFVEQTVDVAAELGVTDRVHVVPKVPPESLVGFLSEADVGVHPLARYPNADVALPNKLFEYLHAGLPVVVSDCPAMADFVRRHDLGEVAGTDDAPSWAGGIERALGAARSGRTDELEALKQEWSWDRQSEALIGVYRQVLNAPPAPRNGVPEPGPDLLRQSLPG